jgi:hypothetical protein
LPTIFRRQIRRQHFEEVQAFPAWTIFGCILPIVSRRMLRRETNRPKPVTMLNDLRTNSTPDRC